MFHHSGQTHPIIMLLKVLDNTKIKERSLHIVKEGTAKEIYPIVLTYYIECGDVLCERKHNGTSVLGFFGVFCVLKAVNQAELNCASVVQVGGINDSSLNEGY